MKEGGHSFRIIKSNRLLPLTCDQCFTFLHAVHEEHITSKTFTHAQNVSQLRKAR